MATVLRAADGATIELDVGRWRTDPDPHEVALLEGVDDPLLDIGCGPGRVVRALAASGRLVLGIDPAPSAAAEAARGGVPVLQRSVFSALPGEGRWGTALLMDGNVGIGGDPVALLSRCRELIRPGGRVVAEVEGPGTETVPLTVRVEAGGRAGPWFRWAVVGVDAWPSLAVQAGLAPEGFHAVGGRWFGRATRP